MKQRVKSIEIPNITKSIKEIDGDREIFISKSLAISDRIIELILAKPWLRKEFAERMGKSESEISRLLSGTHNYTLRMIAKIEAVLAEDIIKIPKSGKDIFVSQSAIGVYTTKQDLFSEYNAAWQSSQIAKVICLPVGTKAKMELEKAS